MVGDLLNMTYIISSGKKKIKYNVNGISEGSRDTQQDRWNLLIQIITKNPMIPHTHVIKLVFAFSKTSKRTTEKELTRLEEEKFLKSHKKGSSPNAPRLWEIIVPEMEPEKKYKKILREFISELSLGFNRFQKKYVVMNELDQCRSLACLLQTISSTLTINKHYGIITNIEKELSDLHQLEKKVLQLSLTTNLGMILQMVFTQNVPYANTFRETIKKYE